MWTVTSSLDYLNIRKERQTSVGCFQKLNDGRWKKWMETKSALKTVVCSVTCRVNKLLVCDLGILVTRFSDPGQNSYQPIHVIVVAVSLLMHVFLLNVLSQNSNTVQIQSQHPANFNPNDWNIIDCNSNCYYLALFIDIFKLKNNHLDFKDEADVTEWWELINFTSISLIFMSLDRNHFFPKVHINYCMVVVSYDLYICSKRLWCVCVGVPLGNC